MSKVDVALNVLDHQILDSEGRRCGNVDDLAIEGDRVTAILVGRRKRIRIPWEEVADIESHVVLRKPAAEYGLGRWDERLRPWIEKIPGAHL